ncbi:MAG: hypothetical protein GY895_09080 [Phycisphaera sp.]|nr:hypothetical protein [Phycisphaera sp.]
MFPGSGPSARDDPGMWEIGDRPADSFRACYTCNLAGDRFRDPRGGEVDLA